MKVAAYALADSDRLSGAQKLIRIGQKPFESDGLLKHLPGMMAGWTGARDLASVPKESFRDWWAKR